MTSICPYTSFEDKANWARSKRDASVAKVEPKLKGLPAELPLSSQDLPKAVLTSKEIEITENYTITELLSALKERALSVEEVTRAFLRRAALAHITTNCLVELMWDEAIARAKHLDSLPEPKGALFGLPISAKEHQGMVGPNVTTSASFGAWIGKPHGSNLLYDTFWEEGCVFYARTTQPQAIMHLETESPIYGRTTNPYNRDLTPGGSSGGESALLGLRGSILGVGSDIGGSIRCPAAHVGVYGFKPSAKRIATTGLRAANGGRETIPGCPGPMAVDRDALELFMKVAVGAEPWNIDPSITVKEWIPHKFTEPLKVAIQWWDGVVQPHPPMIRALREVADACRKAGMTVVDWDCEPLDHKGAWDLLSALYWPDGGKEVLSLIEDAGEPLMDLTKWIILEQPSVKELTQHELWKLCCQRDEYRARYAKAWRDSKKDDGKEVDVIICPPYFGAASTHGNSRYWGYTAQWNLLDYPSAVFPVTTVDAAKDPKDATYTPKNDQDEFVYNLYDPETYQGAPISLQVVGKRQHDEKVLAALTEIERAMGRK
ncbi:unnamed protein product [Clonostachys byssicola]|uniref:amidase n=1 Tax=Clonostachys byssicola TaxID=160290 RepID=A0A9N9U713_9HYPO|nr:unnamed protein product [Clonostachys byssicola]